MGRRTLVIASTAIVVACGRGGPAPAPTAKPATVTSPVKEAQLTSVTLSEEAEKRLAIKTETVTEQTVARSRTVGGEIAPSSGAALSITAPVAGTLHAPSGIPVAGSTVSQGQQLFQLVPIAPSDRDATVDAEQAVATATARRDAATLKTQRAERLFKDGSGSRRALEEAQAELAVAEADLTAARGRVALASRSRSSTGGIVIESPDAATVRNVLVKDGQSVSAGAPLVELVRLASVWVRVPVYAGEVNTIDAAAPAQIFLLGQEDNGPSWQAQPVPAPPSANAATAGVDLYYALANPTHRFRPGERVAVRLPRREAGRGLVVPKAALLHDAFGGTWVYVARGSRVYARERVLVEDISGTNAVLSRGPAPGAKVVTDGAAELFGVEFGAGK